jgi:hypothetical protein
MLQDTTEAAAARKMANEVKTIRDQGKTVLTDDPVHLSTEVMAQCSYDSVSADLRRSRE